MVELYLNEELEDLQITENQEEWNEMLFELGLEGQKKVISKSDKSGVNPYTKADGKTMRIVSLLCPKYSKVEAYSNSQIPLDVMKEIKKCKEHSWFDHIVVYYTDNNPDPFVIGVNGYEFSKSDCYLIARFGDELLPWEELEIKANKELQKKTDHFVNDLKNIIYSIESNPQLALDDMINNGKTYYTPSLNI